MSARDDAGQTLQMFSDLHDRRAVVTGAARGIGLAIARRLLMAGAEAIAIDKDKETLKAEFEFELDQSCRIICDDLAREDAALLADEVVADGGPVELIVNNVGVSAGGSFIGLGDAAVDSIFQSNLLGPWRFTRRLVELLVEAQGRDPGLAERGGSIVFISSVHDTFPSGRPSYDVSKAGVTQLARVMARELAGYRIRVNSISPGWIRTAQDPNAAAQVAKRERMLRYIPMREPGYPDDVAKAALLLLSNWMGYVTGQNLRVDGGLSLSNWTIETNA
jgi:NAD(P)-dependent dehydrogenase (short-subunit alcohol dehydrogenase family)